MAMTDQHKYEIERGKPVPDYSHSLTQSRLTYVLYEKYRDKFHIIPELHLKSEPKDMVPDISIYPIEKIKIDFDNDILKMEIYPDGVIEVITAPQTIREMFQRKKTYTSLGVKSYWLIIPELRSIYVFDQTGEYEVFTKKQLLKDPQLSIEISLGEIF